MMDTLKWISTTLFLSAGLILSLNLPFSKVGFILFLIGHITLLGVFLRHKDWPMIVQNGFFIIIDLIGIYRWFL